MYRVHIVGIAGRTGTTLLAEAMRACFAIDASHEHEAWLWERASGAAIHLSKAPSDILRIGPRLRLDPRLHVICMVRDPRDIVVSRHHRVYPDRYFVGMTRVGRGLRALRRLKGHARLTVVRYEDLVSDPSSVQRYLEFRMPFLERTADFGEFHRVAAVSERAGLALSGLRPIQTTSIGNWRRHLPRIADQREAMTAALIELGYEVDQSWEEVLSEVEPIAQPPLPAPPPRRLVWLTPWLRRPLSLFWRSIRRARRRAFNLVLLPWAEGVRGMFEAFTHSGRG